MTGDAVQPPPAPQEAHGIFVGPIDQQSVQRLANALSIAANNGIGQIHLAFQSAGGTVGDGVCIYNLFRASPIDIAVYNIGTICSAGVTAYLGAATRVVSSTGTFMIHKTFLNPIAAGVEKLQAFANSAIIDDKRLEAIFHGNIKLSSEKWDVHKVADLWLDAKDAVEAGLATKIGDFAPPKGKQLFYVGPL